MSNEDTVVVLEIDRCDDMLSDHQKASLEAGKDATNAEVAIESTTIKRSGKGKAAEIDPAIEEDGTRENDLRSDQRKRPVEKDSEQSPKKQKTPKAIEINGDCEASESTVKSDVKHAQPKKANSQEEHGSVESEMVVDGSAAKSVRSAKMARDALNKIKEVVAAKPQKRGKGKRVVSKKESSEEIADAAAEGLEKIVAAKALKRGKGYKAALSEENNNVIENSAEDDAGKKSIKRGRGARRVSKEDDGGETKNGSEEVAEEILSNLPLKRGRGARGVPKQESGGETKNGPEEVAEEILSNLPLKRGRGARGVAKQENGGETKNGSDEVAEEISTNAPLKRGRAARGVTKQELGDETKDDSEKVAEEIVANVPLKRGRKARGVPNAVLKESKEIHNADDDKESMHEKENGDVIKSVSEETVDGTKMSSKRTNVNSDNLKEEKAVNKDDGDHKIEDNTLEGVKRGRGRGANSKERANDDVTKTGGDAKGKRGTRKRASEDETENKKNALSKDSETKSENAVGPKGKKIAQKKALEAVQIIDPHQDEKKTMTKGKREFQKLASKNASIDDKQEEVCTSNDKRAVRKAANDADTENPKDEAGKPAARGRKRQATVETNQKREEAEPNDAKKGKKLVKEAAIEESEEPSKDQWNLKISSWNVNGVRAWIEKNGLDFLKNENPDIFCVQETKCSEEKLPEKLKSLEGYHCYWLSADKEGYSGVGLVSKEKPVDVQYGIGKKQHDTEGRVITAEYPKFFLVNAYVPNSGRGLTKLAYRQSWDDDFRSFLKKLDKKKPVVLCGDLNVAHEAIDLTNPKTNKKTAGFTEQEREGFSALLAEDFVDTFRLLYPKQEGAYTFWTYLSNSRARNIGWRVDYFVISKRFVSNLCDSTIQKDVMGSDHCPISLLLTI